MEFLRAVLEILDADMTTPVGYGWFHLLFFALSIGMGIVLCLKLKNPTEKQVRTVLLIVSVTSIVLEIYKQINYTFSPTDTGINVDYQWYAFPWQFCSMPMYVGLLGGLTRGKFHDAMCAFLATYSTFAGLCVMLYPAQVFISTIGINIQTMICHGSMLTVGIFLLGTQYVKSTHRTILKAIPVFSAAVLMAMGMNELAHWTDFAGGETFNMFFISPYEDPSLPVYSIVQQYVPYPWCLIIYIAAFSLAAYLILLISMGWMQLKKKAKK
ncbi:MAG: YwaF family protein [Clostridia bacterium]|nr:YwaF family protein [Clostridia bacterium]